MKKTLVWILIMAVPVMVWAITPYKTDPQTGVVSTDTETVISKTNLHDSFSRFYVPNNKQFRAAFETSDDGVEWKQVGIAASGVGTAPTKDKVCPIRIKVRIESECNMPKDPNLAEEIVK